MLSVAPTRSQKLGSLTMAAPYETDRRGCGVTDCHEGLSPEQHKNGPHEKVPAFGA